MSGQSFGPFRIEILGGMDIDGAPRTGVFLSAEIPQLRGVGAMMGEEVAIVRADLPPTLSAALALPEVQALVAASKGLLFAHDHGNGLEGWHNTRERMRAALRAIGEGGE